MPSGVCNRLAAVQVGGTKEITQGETRNVAGDKIQPVTVQHFFNYIFEIFVLILQKSCKTLKQKLMKSD